MLGKNDVLLTLDYLNRILRLDPESGELFWRGGVKQGVTEGSRAGSHSERYAFIRIDGRHHKVHRVIWFMTHGVWPKVLLDHRDRKTKHNRLENLREATHSQNLANRRSRKNSLGLKGVYVDKRKPTTRYRAFISVDGKNRSLGAFPTAQEAHLAYRAAATARFGEFASFE